MKKQLFATLIMLGCLGVTTQARADTITLDNISPTSGSSAIKLSNGVLQLTDKSVSDPTYQIGSAYSTSPVGFETFSASFSFQFSGASTAGSADGIVFVIKNPDSSTSGGPGGALGYGGITIVYPPEHSGTYTGIPNSIGVEFDNYQNSDIGDPSDNHIGINVNGSVVSLAKYDISTKFNGTGPWYAWVDYDGSTLSVSVSQNNAEPATPMLSHGTSDAPFLIGKYVGSSTGLVGFTGSTGNATQTQQVLSLDYNGSPVPEPGTVALLGVGGVLVTGWSRKKRQETAG